MSDNNMDTTVPGIRASIVHITPECRLNRGEQEAFEAAVEIVKDMYLQCLNPSTSRTIFHLVLTAEHDGETVVSGVRHHRPEKAG